MKKRILSMLLVIVMVLSMVPVSALAEEPGAVEGAAASTATLEVTQGKKKTAVNVGDALTLTAKMSDNSPLGTVVWEASNPTLVKLIPKTNGTCRVKGLSAGDVTITVKANGQSAAYALKVNPEVEAATAAAAETTPTTPTTAAVTGQAAQQTQETQQSEQQQSFSLTREAPSTYASVSIDATGANNGVAYEGDTVELTASSRGFLLTPTWEWTIDEEIPGMVDVSKSGNGCTLKANKAGKVTVTAVATTIIGATARNTYILNIKAKGNIEIQTEGKTSVYANKTLQLTAIDKDSREPLAATWTSSNDSVATVGINSGVLTGVTAGKVTITATVAGYQDAKLTDFPVDVNPLSIQHNGETLTGTITIFEEQKLELKVVDACGDEVAANWRSTNEAAAIVNGNTLVGVSAGTSVISAEGTNYEPASLTVTVEGKQDFGNLKLDGSSRAKRLAVLETRKLVALDGAKKPVEGVVWTLAPTENAELIDGNLLKGLKPGKVTLTAAADGFNAAQLVVTVENVLLDSIDVPFFPDSIYVNQSLNLNELQIVPFPEYASDKTIVWLTDDPETAVVENGILHAKKPGEVTVTAQFSDGRTQDMPKKLTVKPTTQIIIDSAFPGTILAGKGLDLSTLATIVDAAGNPVPGASVAWKLISKEEGVTLIGNKLSTRWDMLYQHDLELQATAVGCDAKSVTKFIKVMPQSVSIVLTINGEKVNDKTTVLNLSDPAQVAAGLEITAFVEPETAARGVHWQVIDDYGICKDTVLTSGALNIKPSTSMQNGTVTIKATTQDGTTVSAQTKIQLVRLGKSTLKNVPTKLRGGASLNLKDYLEQAKDLDDKSVTWGLEDTADVVNGKSVWTGKRVASINKTTGKLTTKPVTEKHEIMVTVQGSAGAADKCKITLYPATKSITISSSLKSNIVQYDKIKNFTLTADVQPAAASVWGLSWESSDPSVANVDQNGNVTVYNAGKVRISCQTTDGSKVKGYLNLEITKDAGSVQIVPPFGFNGTLVVGDSTDLKATVRTASGAKAANQKVTWSIEDEYGNATRAAAVTNNGRVMAYDVVQNTKVVVIATSVEDANVMGTYTMTIQPSTKRTLHVYADNEFVNAVYTMNPDDSCVLEGKWEMTATGNDRTAKGCTFTSSNPYVATVDDVGLLESHHAGTTTITAQCTDPQTGNLYTTTFQVNVANMVSAVTITAPDDKVVRSGQWVHLSATAWMDLSAGLYADDQTFDWEVKEKVKGNYVDTDVATIDANGWLLGGEVDKEHTIQIKAISKENGCNATVEFKVYPVDGVTLTLKLNGSEYKDGDVMPMDFDKNRDANKNVKGLTVEATVVSTDTKGNVSVNTVPVNAPEWTSTNTDVIKFSTNYKKITLENVGQTKLTAWYLYKGAYYVATVTANVSQTVGKVVSIEQTNVLVSGKSTNMRVQVKNANATNQNVIWDVKDAAGNETKLATINQYTGLLSAKRGITEQKTLTVTATPVDGSPAADATVIIYPATTKVQIKDAANKVVSGTRVDVQLGSKPATFTAAPIPAAAYDQFTWTSSNESVATVKDGVVTVKKAGRAVIKATAKDGTGKSAKFTLRVTK